MACFRVHFISNFTATVQPTTVPASLRVARHKMQVVNQFHVPLETLTALS